MGLALVFPGQGSQSAGMGRTLHDAFSASRDVFAAVDEALGERLSTLIFDGPDDRLTLTENAQPALMAVSMAALAALGSEGFRISSAECVAGHSLGEYTALAAAGAFSVPDAARLLRLRGRAMQQAVGSGKGAMAAIIGLAAEEVEAICRDAAESGGVCELANDNGGGQIVISGNKEPVESAMALATEHGAKRAIALPVSAPFHCRLMTPAAETMAEALKEAEIARPATPIVTNVSAAPTQDPEIIRENLVAQVTGRVRWRETVEWFAGNGIDRQVEIGSGKVLSGLARRIDRRIETSAVATADDVRGFMAKTS